MLLAQSTRIRPSFAPVLDFELPAHLEAGAPPEARGLERDEVRLMVSHYGDDTLLHSRFCALERFLEPGDLLVINTSGTRPAALSVRRQDGSRLRLHLSSRLPNGCWLLELRQPRGQKTMPFAGGMAGETLTLPEGGTVRLHAPFSEQRRLWQATVDVPGRLDDYLARHGAPIRYRYVQEPWPLDYYQTVYATEPGSAEMPSAGRAFTAALITRLVARGIDVAPLILHTGVASQEAHEPPYPEFYRVPAATARRVNDIRRNGGRIVAVGTTAVRALETVADEAGQVRASEGWTDLVITPKRGIRVVDGLLTGLHEPRASHLAMLEALAGRRHLRRTYEAALAEGYLWHEFGDLHLILP